MRFGFFTIPPDGGAGAPRRPRHRRRAGRVRREAARPGRPHGAGRPGHAHHRHHRLRGRGVGPGHPRARRRRQGGARRGRHLRAERHPPPLVQPRRRSRPCSPSSSSGHPTPRSADQIAWAWRSAMSRISRARSWVASSTTRGARPGVEGLGPAGRAEAPLVAGLQPGEAVLRHRRQQVVPLAEREVEELLGHAGAHRVRAHVLGTGVAAPVAEESGEGRGAALAQLTAEHVLGHAP